MYCRKCGSPNDDNHHSCTKCGAPLHNTPINLPAHQISNYLVQSILVTIFCCLPLGIPAIVYAAQVNGKVQAGDIPGAMRASKLAKTWSWWAFGIGLFFTFFYLLMSVTAATAGY